MEPIIAQLSRRVARLEAQQASLIKTNRLLRMLAGVLMLLGSGGILMAQTSAPVHNQTLEAEQFVLRDSTGKLRGVMGLGENGAEGISLVDNKGATRMTIDLSADGSPGIDLYDGNGKLRATLATGQHGTPGFGFYDENGKLRTALDIPARRTPGLSFYHPDGKPAWGAP